MVERKICWCCYAPHAEEGGYCADCHDCGGTCDPRGEVPVEHTHTGPRGTYYHRHIDGAPVDGPIAEEEDFDED